MKIRSAFLAGVLSAGFAFPTYAASTAGDNPLTSGSKAMYAMVKSTILKSAEEMPESNYSYRPVDSVRTFGQLIAHVADGQYEFCSALAPAGDKNPDVEKTVTGKPALIEALKKSFAYCDKIYDSMTDAQAAQTVNFFGKPYAKLSVLSFNIAHTDEHYGNIVTYLRMKGIVPPSSKQ